MDSIEHFDEARNLARVAAGFKGGPFMTALNTAPSMTFSDGYPETVSQKLDAVGGIPQGNIMDTWITRRNNSSMK